MASPEQDQSAAMAHDFARSARHNYERDGFVVPVLVIESGEGNFYIFTPKDPDGDTETSDQLGRLMGVLSGLRVRRALTITESWMKTYPGVKSDDPPQVVRGQLSRESEFDPDIKTAIVVCVNHSTPDDSFTVISRALGDDPRKIKWENTDIPGLSEGYLTDVIREAMAQPHCPVLKADAPVGAMVGLLIFMDWISACLVDPEEMEL